MNETIKATHTYIVVWNEMRCCSVNYTLEDAMETVENLLDTTPIEDIRVFVDGKIKQPKITLYDV